MIKIKAYRKESFKYTTNPIVDMQTRLRECHAILAEFLRLQAIVKEEREAISKALQEIDKANGREIDPVSLGIKCDDDGFAERLAAAMKAIER